MKIKKIYWIPASNVIPTKPVLDLIGERESRVQFMLDPRIREDDE